MATRTGGLLRRAGEVANIQGIDRVRRLRRGFGESLSRPRPRFDAYRGSLDGSQIRVKRVKPVGAWHEPPKSATPATGATSGNWKLGDKAQHAKWGVGTVVEVRGTGASQEVKVAFPEQGIKLLMVQYAPITRV